MRLINTQTFELKDFGVDPPPYAILSHTWGKGEVTFQEMADLDAARKKTGFAKIEQCCRQARSDGFDWAWVDTCCIDKTSSAELSETINSMFSWYGRAMKCYALLSDVVATQDELFPRPDQEPSPEFQLESPLRYPRHKSVFFTSRWWTRGWTLQELIAPHDVEFYSRDWNYLTSKHACKELIGGACGIAVSVLDQSRALASFCVAERISWASHRITTRDEDMAYCLLGLLDVNMPLLYGEGAHKAFLRLQQHFLAATEDWTIFLWGARHSPATLHVAGPIRDARGSDLPRLASNVASMSRAPIHNILASSPSSFRPARLSEWLGWSSAGQNVLGFEPSSTALKLPVGIGTGGARTFVRLMAFIYDIPAPELADKGWNLTTCYIKMQTELENRQSQQPRQYNRFLSSRWPLIWSWRTPKPDIPSKSITARFRGSDELGARHSLHLSTTETFPGCLIRLAVRAGYYWLDVQAGNRVDLKTQAARLSKMDLSRLWVETTRETGPVCEERVDFESKSLLITLWIKQSSRLFAKDWYKMYLAIVERRG
ncbi:hypothetical protein NEMBOFW57_007884 [Staphylotrichum longicolle]|uniref:Heterokaryon incompatibility domain-containing protein n=1 Tax=Staphylotrichum longicolle TaxID=669026 RepID=A0AAD4EZY8_9PEZI|nr:hypothetical protein NEMBOFW57_007884 [Staphylotrichum longicolle]